MMILISGSSGSGKSAFGEDLLVKLSKGDNLLYIATMKPFGVEAQERILRHKILRQNKNFSTLEVYQDLESIIVDKNSNILLECMSNLLANEMFCEKKSPDVVEKILMGIKHLKDNCKNLVIISNEVFSDGCKYDVSTIKYIQNLGIINQRIAKLSDIVIECVCSNPVVYKGDISWVG